MTPIRPLNSLSQLIHLDHPSPPVVLIRLDLNVPLNDQGDITDATRILHGLDTIKSVLSITPRVILASHLSRPPAHICAPEQLSDAEYLKYSLSAAGERLAELLDRDVVLWENPSQASPASAFPHLGKDSIILVENLRLFSGEAANDSAFAASLGRGVDYYVNEAFGVCHRRHASVDALPDLLGADRCFAGIGLQREISELSSALTSPQPPLMVMMGGSKVPDKIGALLGLITHARCVMIGGRMAYPFLALKGIRLGATVVHDEDLKAARVIWQKIKDRRVQLLLPVDHICAPSLGSPRDHLITSADEHIPNGLKAFDIGPRTCNLFKEQIMLAKTLVWNGPLGAFETPAFSTGSHTIAHAVAAAPGTTLVGGGDSLALLGGLGLNDQIDHLCTGGGAMLAFFNLGTRLPALSHLCALPKAPQRHSWGALSSAELEDDDDHLPNH